MFQEANDQLENIDPFNRVAPEVLAARIAIYHGLKKWELMQEVTKRLVEFEPNDIQWTISLAYATRRVDSIQTAKEILLNAESKFPKRQLRECFSSAGLASRTLIGDCYSPNSTCSVPSNLPVITIDPSHPVA